MGRLFKVIGVILGAFVLLAVIALIALVVLINPNKYKPFISKQIYLKTGKQVIFKGAIGWSLFPSLGFQINDIVLTNPPGFGDQATFVEVHRAQIEVKVMPLLHKRVETKDIILDGLTLNLIRNNQGKNNWESTPQAPAKPSVQPIDVADVSPSDDEDSSKLDFMIPSIALKNTVVSWLNLQKSQSIQISHLSLSLQDIQPGIPMSIKVSFEYRSSHPALDGFVTARAVLLYKDATQTAELSHINATIKLTGDRLPNKRLNASLTGDLTISPSSLQSDQFTLTANQSVVTGKLSINTHAAKAPDDDFLRNLSAKGQVSINNLSAFNFTAINQVQIAFSGKNGVIYAPVTANVYQGKLNGNVQVNFQSQTPVIHVSSVLSGVQIQPLLMDLAKEKFLLGDANIDMDMTASLGTGNIVRSLNGKLKFSVLNGKLEGIDLVKFIQFARQVTHPQELIFDKPSGETVFDSLTGSAVIRNGVLTNRDLAISSKISDVKGHGTINLNNEQFHYTLEANEHSDNLLGAIPLEIFGTFSNYHAIINPFKLLTNTLVKNAKNILNDATDNALVNSGKEGLGQAINKTLDSFLH